MQPCRPCQRCERSLTASESVSNPINALLGTRLVPSSLFLPLEETGRMLMNDSGLPSERRISVGIPLSCLLEYPASHDINNLGMPGETCKTTIVDILRSKNTYWSGMKKTLGSRRVRKRQGDWKGPRISRSRRRYFGFSGIGKPSGGAPSYAEPFTISISSSAGELSWSKTPWKSRRLVAMRRVGNDYPLCDRSFLSPRLSLFGFSSQSRSNRSRSMTLFQAATKSCRNFSWESSHA